MKIRSITLLLLFLSYPAISQTRCEDFRTGKFHNIENGVINTTIERNDSIQIEHFGEMVMKLKVSWLDSCSYRLTLLEANDAWWNSLGDDKSAPDLIIRITEITSEDSYQQETTIIGTEKVIYKSTIKKIE